jgi:aminoglycoside phosphotransferase (APT) family kinase protein
MSDVDTEAVLSGGAHEVLVAAGRQAGVPTADATLMRDGSNALYGVTDEVVARVGPPGSEHAAARQVQASQWLARAGIPVVRAVGTIEQPTVVGDRPVTWWVRLRDPRHATPAELGAVLARLHALDIPESPGLFPAVDPFEGLRAAIDDGAVLAEKDRAWLRDLLDRLHLEYTASVAPGMPRHVIHGDAWQGNVVVPAGEGVPVLLDLDHIGIGPREWDLVSLAVDYTDFARISEADYQAFVGAYGGYDMTTWPGYRTLATVRELRWTAFVLGKGDTDQKAAKEVLHRVACLRGEISQPWSWSAF